jgi:ABC-type nitrate/sulfonate/bicarbonate transport system substrate-binding protein
MLNGPFRTLWLSGVLALLLGSCAPARPAPAIAPTAAATAVVAPRHLVLGMPVTPPNLPHVGVYVAQELGYFADEGLDIEIKSFESGVQVLRGGISGGIDIVGSSSEPVIAAIAQGASLKVIYSSASDVERTIAALRDLGNLQATDSIGPAQVIDRGPATEAVQALGGPMSGDPRWK